MPAPYTQNREHQQQPKEAENELVKSSQEFDVAQGEHGSEAKMQVPSGVPTVQMATESGGSLSLTVAEPTMTVAPGANTSDIQLQEEEEDMGMSPKLQLMEFGGGSEAPTDPEDDDSIQPKLTIGQPGDKYEREADTVASKVVQGIQAPEVQSKKEEDLVHEKVSGGLQTMLQAQFPDIPEVDKEPPEMEVATDELMQEGVEEIPDVEAEGEAEVATDVPAPVPVEEIEAPEITTKSDSNTSGKSPGSSIAQGLSQSKGGGSNLQGGVKGEMESGFGTDFSGVKVHTDSNAVQMNKELGSRAFTNQNNIYFNEGQYNPDSTEGKTLLAHELTHTIQQGAVSNTVQASNWGDKPLISTEPKATVPSDGDKVESRSDRKIKNDPDFDDDAPTSMSEMDEEDREKSKPDRSEVRKENREVAASGVSEVDEDRGKTASDKSKDQKAQIEQNVDKAAETDDSEASVEEGEEAELSEADAATQRATVALEQANAVPIPKKPEAFNHPKIEAPVDKEGKPLPRKGNVDTQVRGLGYMGELFREHGYEIKKAATNSIIYAHGLDSNLETQRADLANAKEGTATMEQHNIARQEISENSKAALKDSQERQAFVAEKAPQIASKAQEGQSESSDLLSESESKSSKSKSKMSSDPDARAKAEKQSSGIGDAAEGAESMDQAIKQAGERAVQYQQEAEQAAAKNEETKGSIDETDTLIEQTSTRIVEMMGINEASQAKIDNVAEGPAQMRTDAEVSIQEGDKLISASYVMEKELHEIQTQYLAGMKAIETKEEAEERIKKEKDKNGPKPSPQEQEVVGLAGLPEKEQQKRVDEISKSKDGAKKKAGLMAALDKMITKAPDKGTDATEGPRKEFKSGLQDKIMGGPPPSDPRMPAIQKVDQARESRLSGVMDIGDENIGVLTEAEKSMLAQKLTGEAVADDIKNIDVLQMGAMMLQGMVDPRMALTGPIDGFDKMATGVANIFNADAWEKDPLGNLLKIAADISTGLAMIFSGILGIAGFIMGVMIALSIASWGFALPITVPQMAWMGTLMGYAGWGAIIAGSLSVYFNYLSYLKNLNDAATAELARELFGNVEEMKENVTDGFTGAMSIVEGVGAVKMGPMMKQGNFVDTSAMGTIDTVKGISSGIKNAPAALKKLPGNLAAGARRLFAGGKQGLIDFKDKLKTYFARAEADVPGPVRTRNADAPATTDVGRPSATRTDVEAPTTSTTRTDSAAPTTTRNSDAEAPATTRTDTDAPSPTREVDSDSTTTNRAGDQDAPGTTRKNDTDADATTSRKDGDSPEKSKIKTDADGDLGTVDGQKVKAETKDPDGHTRKVLADGQCARCTKCQTTRERYQELLGKTEDLPEGRFPETKVKPKDGGRNKVEYQDLIDGPDGIKQQLATAQKALQNNPTDMKAIKKVRELEGELDRIHHELDGFRVLGDNPLSEYRQKHKLLNEALASDFSARNLSKAEIDLIRDHFNKGIYDKRYKLPFTGRGKKIRFSKPLDEFLLDAKAFKWADEVSKSNEFLPDVYRELKRITPPLSDADMDMLTTHFKANVSSDYPRKTRTNFEETLRNLKQGKDWDPGTRTFVADPDKEITHFSNRTDDSFSLGEGSNSELKQPSNTNGSAYQELKVQHTELADPELKIEILDRDTDGNIKKEGGVPKTKEVSAKDAFDELEKFRTAQVEHRDSFKGDHDGYYQARENFVTVSDGLENLPNLTTADVKLIEALNKARIDMLKKANDPAKFREAKAKLQQRIEALDSSANLRGYKQQLEGSLTAMDDNLDGLMNYRAAQKQVIDASEELGEAAVDAVITAKVPGARKLDTKLPGKGKQGEFDRIYIDENGNIYLVEAKGGSSTLGSREVDLASGERVRAQQGSKEYQDDLIARLREAAKTDAGLADTVKAIDDAILNNKQVQYLHMKQEIGTGEVLVYKFDTSKTHDKKSRY